MMIVVVVVVVVVVVHILNTILGEVGELVDSTLPRLTGTVLLLDLVENERELMSNVGAFAALLLLLINVGHLGYVLCKD